MHRRSRSSGAIVSLAATGAAWLSLIVRALDGPWAPFVPLFLLLGATGALVGLAAALIERTWLSLIALAAGCVAPVTTIVFWIATGPHEL